MEWLYFGLLIAIILVMFIVLKRPMYEAMAVGFLAVVIALGKIGSIGQYFASTVSFYALYMIAAFIVFGSVLERSNVIQDMIDIIISLVGRFSGGGNYHAKAVLPGRRGKCSRFRRRPVSGKHMYFHWDSHILE